MTSQVRGTVAIEALVDRMFDRVLEADQRSRLLARIREWESANAHLDNAHRVTGWIDIAYEFQAGRAMHADAGVARGHA